MPTTKCVLYLVGTLVSCTSLACADTVTLPAAKDNTLYQDDLGLLSNGAGSYFFAGVNGNGEIRRGLIAFDLSSIPPAAVISSASLRLRLSRTSAGPEPVTLHRMLQNWGEGASNAAANEGMGIAAQPGDATWVHAFSPLALWDDGTPNPPMGGHFDPASSATTTVDQVGFYTWSSQALTADIQRFVTAPSENFGWLVQGFEEDIMTAKRFDSRQNTTVANRPSLTVTYTIPKPMCQCDFDSDGHVTSADFFGYLTAFFTELPAADFDGSGTVTSADFFAFISCFFSLPGACM